MKTFVVILLLFAQSLLFSNNMKIDSLEQLLPGSSGKERIEILIGLADATCNSTPAKSLVYSQKAYQLAISADEQEMIAASLNMIAFSHFYSYDFLNAADYLKQSLRIYTELGNRDEMAKKSQNIGLAYMQANEYDSSLTYIQQAYTLYVELNEPANISDCRTDLGLVYYFKGEYAVALGHYNKALEICREIDDPVVYANLLNRIGMTYRILGINDKALAYMLETVKEREKIGEPGKIATGYNNIGSIYKEMGKFKKALEYFNLALLVYRQTGDSLGMTYPLTNIGSVYNLTNNPDSALMYYKHSLIISEALGNDLQSAKTRHNMGLVFKNMGQPDKAVVYIQEYLTYCSQIGNQEGIIDASLNLGGIFLTKGNYQRADKLLTNALLLSDSLDLMPSLQLVYATLSKLREKQGDVNAAFKYYKQSSQLKDSILDIEKAKAISEMETKYETEKKEKENLSLKKNNEIQQLKLSHQKTALYSMSAGIIVALILLTLTFVSYRKRSIAYRNLVAKNLELAQCDKKIIESGELIPLSVQEKGSRESEDSNEIIKELEIIEKFNAYLSEEKPYLFSGINIEEACAQIGTNRTYLSRAINTVFNKSFNTIINEFRIRTARQLLTDEKYSHISIEGIGQMAGYHSRTAFINNFKKVTGLTPSYFKASISKKS